MTTAPSWGNSHARSRGVVHEVALWCLILIGSAAAGASVAYGGPELVIGIPLGVAALAVAIRWPKFSVAVAVVSIFFSRMPALLVPALDSIDEASIFGLAAAAVWRTASGVAPLRRSPGAIAVMIAIVLAGIGSLDSGIGPKLALLDAYLVFKGFVLYVAVCQLPWTRTDVRKAIRVGWWASVVALGLLAVNMVVGAPWYRLFANHGWVVARGGINIPVGPFGHPGWAGQALALMSAAAFAYGVAFGANRWSRALLALSIPATVLTQRRKAILGLVGALWAVAVSDRGARRRALPVLVVVFIAVLGVAGRDIVHAYQATYSEYIRDASDAPRTMLYRAAADIATNDFPLGAGLGRFGTSVAFDHYSPIYYDLGFNRYYGFAPKTGNFATDTYWPGIIGEAGWFGLLAVASALVVAARPARRLVRSSSPELRFVGLVGVAWSVEFALESFAAPVYNTAPLYPLLFGILGMAVALERTRDASLILARAPQESEVHE